MRDLLKIMTCGSVDDGKSTLIGRLMYDAGCLHPDQEAALKRESALIYGEKIDYSLLLDGLEAEREQRITIDVAYRFFSTAKRSFVIADTPGHDEYTRNMAVGASFSDLAVILIDAGKGVLSQTKRHFRICRLMGITDFIFAVNKMDTVGYSEGRFAELSGEIDRLIEDGAGLYHVCIPVSAVDGENVVSRGGRTGWYVGKTLLEELESFDPGTLRETGTYMPVQRVEKTESAGRGYQGCVECGSISVGDNVTVYPSGERSKVSSLLVSGAAARTAECGRQITVRLEDEIDVSRGCVICSGFVPSVSTNIEAELLWTDDAPLAPGKSYYMKLAASRVPVTVSTDKAYEKNDIFSCVISASAEVVTDKFLSHRTLGEFILIDRVTHATAAWGRVTRPLDNNYIYPITSEITRRDRAAQKGQTPVTLWLTGLPASGKTTVANEVEKRLYAMGKHTYIIDGDDLRSGINSGLGFTKEGRAENIRIAAHVARMMNDAGLITVVSLVSPFAADRLIARDTVGEGFYEIYLSAPANVCEKRDKKGYYLKAREGRIAGFTGVSGSYEPPSSPDLTLDTAALDPSECADAVTAFLKEKGLL